MNRNLQSGRKLLADYKSESHGMSKLIRRRAAFLMTFILLTASMLVGFRSVATRAQTVGVASSRAARNAAIVAATLAVLKETSTIRELPILRPVRSGAQSRSEIERMVIRNIDEETSPDEMHATELALKKFGLVPNEFKYRPFVIKLLTEQVAGYYDPKVQRFYLADWIELEGQKPVMAHELTHALQDQHFDLRRFQRWPKGDGDAELAAHALIEGDATLAMTLYMARNPMVALAFMRSLGSTGTSSEEFKQAPRALRESLVFPYERGVEWATQLYKRGGWSMVSEAFKKLPQSTEQILHVEKYFAHETPVAVALADVKNLLGPNWSRLDYDVNGEWSYYLILDEFLNSPSESRRAAAGWGGDRYSLYEGPNSSNVFLAHLTAWDTEADAREFFESYVKRTLLRYTDATAVEPPVLLSQNGVDSSRNESHAWQTSEGGVVVELRGSRILILEGIPDGVDAKALLKALWQ